MTTFYLLPSRAFVGERFGDFLANLIPGLDHSSSSWVDLAESLANLAQAQSGAYVLFREDIDDSQDLDHVLQADFGAESGDEVFELHTGVDPFDVVIHRWNLAASPQPAILRRAA